jgi:hypothetical protein
MEQITKDGYASNEDLVKRVEWHTCGKAAPDIENVLKDMGITLERY